MGQKARRAADKQNDMYTHSNEINCSIKSNLPKKKM